GLGTGRPAGPRQPGRYGCQGKYRAPAIKRGCGAGETKCPSMNLLSLVAKHLSLVSRRGKARPPPEPTVSRQPPYFGDRTARPHHHDPRLSHLGPERRMEWGKNRRISARPRDPSLARFSPHRYSLGCG